MLGRRHRREAPAPKRRMLTIDAGFVVGLVLVGLLAWWVRGDAPPGLRGEPDFSPLHGAPFLVVYGAPSCAACPAEWAALRRTLPTGLRVVHLRVREADGPAPDADDARAWAEALGVATADVAPADLVRQRLPAVVLRNERARWRFEHTGPMDAKGREGLQRALRMEGIGIPVPAP